MQLTDRDKREFQRLQKWRGRRVLFFDTETSGLPRSGGLDRQPYVIQLAFMFGQLGKGVGSPFKVHAKASMLIDLPRGKVVDAGAESVHGISGEDLDLFGVSRSSAIQLFAHYMSSADVTIGHNVQFDMARIWDEFRREPLLDDVVSDNYDHIDTECTMRLTRDICAIPPTAKMIAAGRNHYKSPQLGESYQKLFGKKLEGAHDAMVDVEACVDLFQEVLDLGAPSKRAQPEELIDG